MGAFLLAAEAAADAAVALRFRGITRKVAAADAKASGLARQVSGVRTPALQSATARAILTSSERQVGLLAAAGRSNRQIAQELCVSVRTVENHLQRSYTKLGIAGRSELAPLLEPAARPDD
jgi:DNA-binding NarL/FixJ family response regulator